MIKCQFSFRILSLSYPDLIILDTRHSMNSYQWFKWIWSCPQVINGSTTFCDNTKINSIIMTSEIIGLYGISSQIHWSNELTTSSPVTQAPGLKKTVCHPRNPNSLSIKSPSMHSRATSKRVSNNYGLEP